MPFLTRLLVLLTICGIPLQALGNPRCGCCQEDRLGATATESAPTCCSQRKAAQPAEQGGSPAAQHNSTCRCQVKPAAPAESRQQVVEPSQSDSALDQFVGDSNSAQPATHQQAALAVIAPPGERLPILFCCLLN